MADGERVVTDPYVSADDDEYEALQAGIARRIGDYRCNPAAEELAAAWRISNRGAPAPEPAPEPETEDAVVDYSVEPW